MGKLQIGVDLAPKEAKNLTYLDDILDEERRGKHYSNKIRKS